jgi:hypothetical protein
MNEYKAIVEAGGGKFISAHPSQNSVYFWDETESRVLSLYISALTVENVRLALKDARERVLDFPPLQPTDTL